MLELSKDKYNQIIPLCMAIKNDDVVLWSIVEGNIGKIYVNTINNPTCAIVAGADFCFLLGDPDGFADRIFFEQLNNIGRRKIIVTSDFSWEVKLKKNFPHTFKSFKRYALKGWMESFSKKQLYDYIEAIVPKYKLEKIDKTIYYKALENDWTADFCCFFSSVNDFLKNGIGYVILDKGEIISGAASYTYCKDKIAITIGTKEEYRHRGLALACASKLVIECVGSNIYPQWDAANLGSVKLAEKIGYHFEREYVVYSI